MRSFEGALGHAWRPRRRTLVRALGLGMLIPASHAISSETPGPSVAGAVSHWFNTSDGARLHYLEAGASSSAAHAPTIVFVPGWTMPAWIWKAQIEHLAPRARVLALDPRGQGRSAIPHEGYDYARRAADIAELLAAARCREPVVLVGWSLGVLESLQYLHDTRQAGAATPVRGLVLVDNSVGVGDPPTSDPTFFSRLRNKRRETVSGFVASMFKRAPEPHWREALVEAAMRTPLQASIDLLRQARPREFWRNSLYATTQPVLYAYTPRFEQQGEIVKARRPSIETRLFAEAGHALFVDEAVAFNDALDQFVMRATAPAAAASVHGGASR
jgi:microsomal epoxide hydrolase